MGVTQSGSYERNLAYKAQQEQAAADAAAAAAAATQAKNNAFYGSAPASVVPQGRQTFTGTNLPAYSSPGAGRASSDLASAYGGAAPLNAAAQANVNGLSPQMSPQQQAVMDAAMARRGAGVSGGAMVQAPFAGRQQGAAMGPAQRMQLPPMGQPRPMSSVDPFAPMPPRAQGQPQRMGPAMTQRGGMGGAVPMASPGGRAGGLYTGAGAAPVGGASTGGVAGARGTIDGSQYNNNLGGASLGGALGGSPTPEQQAQIQAQMAAKAAAMGR